MNDYFLADDLSGALEVAAAFHGAGRSAVVTWSVDGWEACGPDDVVGFDTETRNAAPEAAAEAVARALAQGRKRGGRLLFKKIDSTMRGPVAAELAAVASALPDTTLLFTPANPHAGRTVRDGVLLVHGVPVAETEFGRDPVSPVRNSSILSVLPPGRRDVIPVDAAGDDDLRRAVAKQEARGGPWVAVGSGAFARLLAPRLVEPMGARASRPPRLSPAGRVLFVCGSAHPVNHAQAARLKKERSIAVFDVDPADAGPAVRSAVAALRTAQAAGLRIAPAPEAVADSRAALEAIVGVACQAIAETGVRRVLVTGGETARALCDAVGVPMLRVLGDIEPGLVLAGSGDWLFAIKPGGFGSESSWVRALDALR
jgi:uncharacterized protein YgbK (DUF1537 family)